LGILIIIGIIPVIIIILSMNINFKNNFIEKILGYILILTSSLFIILGIISISLNLSTDIKNSKFETERNSIIMLYKDGSINGYDIIDFNLSITNYKILSENKWINSFYPKNAIKGIEFITEEDLK